MYIYFYKKSEDILVNAIYILKKTLKKQCKIKLKEKSNVGTEGKKNINLKFLK